MPKSPEQRPIRAFILTLGAITFLILGLSLSLPGENLKKETFLCWLLNGFNAYSFAFICRTAIGSDFTVFLARFLLTQSLRVAGILALIFGAWKLDHLDFEATAIMALAGYFLVLFIEVKELARKAL